MRTIIVVTVMLLFISFCAYAYSWGGGYGSSPYGGQRFGVGAWNSGTSSPSGDWILETGNWNDSGVWDDTAIWDDGA